MESLTSGDLRPLGLTLMVLGSVSLLRTTIKAASLVRWYVLRTSTKPLLRYGDEEGQAWAVVTGASSGVGEAFAHELAKDGFHLILTARREDRLQALAEALKREYNVETAVVTADFAQFATQSEAYMKRVVDLSGGNVGVVVHMAGNSDLALHFTDKPLNRNLEIMHTTAESTLIVLQDFCALLAGRRHRSAIVTSGAIPAFLPMPGFCTSAANKHYVRALSREAAHEFAPAIDIVCAHPIIVQSEIVTQPIFASITQHKFARGVLADLGHCDETNGFWGHDLFCFALSSLPDPVFRFIFSQPSVLAYYSRVLNRPIDTRALKDKFPVRRR